MDEPQPALRRAEALRLIAPNANELLFLGLFNLAFSLWLLLGAQPTLNQLEELRAAVEESALALGLAEASWKPSIEHILLAIKARGLVSVAVSALIAYGGWCLRQLELRPMCIAACLLSMVPLLTPDLTFVAGLFFGTRALRALHRKELQPHFT